MTVLAIIGGSGLYNLGSPDHARVIEVQTPYQTESVSVLQEEFAGAEVYFIPRHGRNHSIPPHRINYRANLAALKELEVTDILAVNAVGGINPAMGPGHLVLPHQLIDYTWGREHSFFDGLSSMHNHVDFSHPYDETLRRCLNMACKAQKVSFSAQGIYACTQGPRLETAAEIQRLANEGCDIVGMTGMPEAALARELNLNYACIALVVNWAAGLQDEPISMAELQTVMTAGIGEVIRVLDKTLSLIDNVRQ